MAGETTSSWSDLPDDALHIILTYLYSFTDFISFSSVCRSWRAVASSLSPTFRFPPLLLSPTFECDTYRLLLLRLFDPASPSFSSSLSRSSHKFASISFISYSHGCLLRFSEKKDRVVILDLFRSDEICSPIIPLSSTELILSAYPVLTSSLSSPDSVLMLPIHTCLYYWRIRSPSWTHAHVRAFKNTRDMPVITVQGKVYASDPPQNLYVLEFSPEFHLRAIEVEGVEESIEQHLVDCGGELLSLQVVPVGEESTSAHVEVFWLDSSLNETRWVKKETLGNWAIFVGYDSGVPGIAVENPERWGGRSNCVYFATESDNDLSWMVAELGDEVFPWDEASPLYRERFALSIVLVHPGF